MIDNYDIDYVSLTDLDFNKMFPKDVFNQNNVWLRHNVPIMYFYFDEDHQSRYNYTYDNGSHLCLVGIIQDNPQEIGVGFSYCGKKDTYTKKIARELAYMRAFFTPTYFNLDTIIKRYINWRLSPTHIWSMSKFERDALKYTEELVTNGTLNFYDFSINYLFSFFYKTKINNGKLEAEYPTSSNISLRDKEIIHFYSTLALEFNLHLCMKETLMGSYGAKEHYMPVITEQVSNDEIIKMENYSDLSEESEEEYIEPKFRNKKRLPKFKEGKKEKGWKSKTHMRKSWGGDPRNSIKYMFEEEN